MYVALSQGSVPWDSRVWLGNEFIGIKYVKQHKKPDSMKCCEAGSHEGSSRESKVCGELTGEDLGRPAGSGGCWETAEGGTGDSWRTGSKLGHGAKLFCALVFIYAIPLRIVISIGPGFQKIQLVPLLQWSPN